MKKIHNRTKNPPMARRSSALLLMVVMLLVPLSGCIDEAMPPSGEDVVEPEDETTTLEEPWSAMHVDSASDLPDCPGTTNENLGRLYFVHDVSEFHSCTSTGWQVVVIGPQSTTSDLPPRINADVFADDDWHELGWDGSTDPWMYKGILSWSAVDPEGTAVTVGVDHDRDGTVDIALPYAEGGIFSEDDPFVTIPWNGTIIAERWDTGESCAMSFMRMFDLVATDSTGQSAAFTVVTGAFQSTGGAIGNLMEAPDVIDGDAELYFGNYITQDDIDWITGDLATSPCDVYMNGGGNNGGGNLAMYSFSLADSSAAATTGTDDELFYAQFTMGSDLEWGMGISVVLSVDGGPPATCQYSPAGDGSDTTNVCYMSEMGDTTDSFLTVGDGMVIHENGQDLCNSMCSIDFQVTYDGSVIYSGNVIVDDN